MHFLYLIIMIIKREYQISFIALKRNTVKPVYNDPIMALGQLDELQKAEIVCKCNWYFQSSIKHIIE